MQPIARIRLFGQFDLRLGGEALPPLDSARAESLLAYLLLHRDTPQSRQQLAFLLWPDSTETQARTNLRHVLHRLRNRLPDADQYLEITSRTLRWRPEAPYWLDVAVFEQLLETAGDRRQALREAVQLYTGDLLEGCYDEWLLAERDRLRHRRLDALAELAGLCEAGGEVVEAISHAGQLLRGDPLREQTYRQLMRLHDAHGDRARALRVYHACCSTLERELGVEPSAATQQVYQALLPDVRPAPVPRAGGPPLVGRSAQRAQLTAAWRSADAGQAQLVLVTGEPGVGKSRLVEEVRAWCARRGVATADARCYPAEGPLAYGPVVAWLRSEALRSRLPRLDPARLTELARLLPELLIEIPELQRPGPLPESDQRRLLFDAVSAAVRVAAPVLLTVDDLQHGDRETCQLLHYLLRVQPDARVLVVATTRREDIDDGHPMHDLLAGLHARERLSEIELTRLSRAETAALAAGVTGAPLTGADAQRLYTETEGNPLFIVEAVRAGWPAGRPLSPRVQAVIEARLAALSEPARDLVGVAATIGRAFSTEVLSAATDAGKDTLVRSLDELWRRRIVREHAAEGYDFSHDKIRQVAYLGLSPARRRQLHLRIAAALEQVGATGTTAQIAAQYERGGAAVQAITWYRRAAQKAQLLHANDQAVRLLERSLGLLRSLPGSTDRDVVELEVHTELLAPLVSVQGYASPAISASQRRAGQLARALGVDPTPPLLRSLAVSALTRDDFTEAARAGHLLRTAGKRLGDDVLLVEAAYVLGIASFWQAEFESARQQFELAIERYRPEDRRTHLIRYGQDPKVICQSRLGNTLWFLGQPDAARAARAAALAWAEEIEHPYSRVGALVFGALLALDMTDEPDVRKYTKALTEAGQQPLPVSQTATALSGYVAVLDGDVDRGIARIRDAIQQARESSAPGHRAALGRILLAACVASGDQHAVLAAADRLLDMGGAACVWAPVARRVRAGTARADG